MRLFYRTLLLIFGLLAAGASSATSDLEERATISTWSKQAFLERRFSDLNAASRIYRRDKSRTPSGLWRLSVFYAGIEAAIYGYTEGQERGAAFGELERKTAAWAQEYPESPAAHIAYSMVLIEHAWAYRGTGFAPEVRQEDWAPFRHYIALARQNLETHKPVAAIDPRWYETMLTIARAQAWERSQFDSLLAEALEREPLFYQTYFEALEYLLPKWHGGTHEIEAFAQGAVMRTSTWDRRGIYARMYWYASQTQFHNTLFSGSHAQWSRMKDGFEDLVADYPDAWNLNHYAKFACLAKDKASTRTLLKRIQSQFVPQAWSPSLRQQCAAWARRKN